MAFGPSAWIAYRTSENTQRARHGRVDGQVERAELLREADHVAAVPHVDAPRGVDEHRRADAPVQLGELATEDVRQIRHAERLEVLGGKHGLDRHPPVRREEREVLAGRERADLADDRGFSSWFAGTNASMDTTEPNVLDGVARRCASISRELTRVRLVAREERRGRGARRTDRPPARPTTPPARFERGGVAQVAEVVLERVFANRATNPIDASESRTATTVVSRGARSTRCETASVKIGCEGRPCAGWASAAPRRGRAAASSRRRTATRAPCPGRR